MANVLPLHSTASRSEIERRAKKIFHARGRPAGRALGHWLEAEAEFMLSVALRNGHADPRPTEAGLMRFPPLR